MQIKIRTSHIDVRHSCSWQNLIAGLSLLWAVMAFPVRATASEFPDAGVSDSAAAYTDTVAKPVIKNFEREIEQVQFVPKGQWIAGVSVSYSQSSQDNYQFLIIENLNGDTYSFKVSPMVLYAFKDNLAVGGRLGYTRQRTQLDKARFVLDSETDYDVDHLYSISHKFYGMAAFRNYMSLGSGTRFGLFNEVQLEFGGGESKIEKGSGVDFTGTFERTFSINVGLAPGMVMFLNNYSAIEVNVGVLGFNYNHAKATTDRIYVAKHNSKSANFRINLFSITFGCVFYI
ncbi:MAG: hypothetical protein Q4F07_07015 [Bacteroidales bacterium]|nr:hypothetical protein [Bacteroidales bacterium]